MPKKILTEEEEKLKARLGKIQKMLDRAWSRDPERFAVLSKAKRAYTGPNKRQKVEYKCAGCGNYFKGTEISVDHIVPKSTLTWENIGEWVLRLFCFREGLQVLCKNKCHQKKTNEENAQRRQKRNAAKKDAKVVTKVPRLRRRKHG